MEMEEARRLRVLEEENARLKRVVADQAVQIQILKELNLKKW
jgi:putative transposase